MGLFDKGYMKFDLVYDSYAQTIDGFGCDYAGLFTAVGTSDGVNIDFVKDYGTHSWIYTGRKKGSSKKNEFSGVWGIQQQLGRVKAGGSFVLISFYQGHARARPS